MNHESSQPTNHTGEAMAARMHTRRELISLAGTAMGGFSLAALLAACGDDEGSETQATGPGGSAAPSLVRIKAAGSGSGSSGVMRQALKLAAGELGLADVEIAHMAQGTALLSVRDGSVQVAMYSWANFGQAAEQNVDVIAIAPAWASHASIMVPSDSEVMTLEDLKGKRVGSAERTTGVYSETRAMLAAQGISIEDDFRLQPMGDSTVMLALYKQGEFEAIIDSEPSIAQELSAGTSRELVQVGTYQAERNEGRFMPVNSWGVRRDWAEDHDVAQLQKLFIRASEIAKTSFEPYELAMADSGLDEAASKLFFERFAKLIVTEFTDQNLADAQVLMDTAHELELVKEEHKVTDFAYRGG